jgi:hypothetical protein
MGSFCLLGLDTLELIAVGDEKSPALSWPLMDHCGPVLHLFGLGAKKDKIVMMPKDLLEILYQRFAALNPKGAVLVAGEGYWKYAPPGMGKEEAFRLADEGKLFQDITDDGNFYPRLREIMPELTQPDVLAHLASDPELDYQLMMRSTSSAYGPRHWRWLPEWAAYVEAYKRAHAST